MLDHSDVIERLNQQLLDPRDPTRVVHSLSSQLRTLLIQCAQGWEDWNPERIVTLYRKRGKVEGHMGELKDTLNVHLSLTCQGTSTF